MEEKPSFCAFLNTFIEFNLFQIEIFSGEDNILTMNQTHSKKFHCTYLLHYYPFDTQGIYSFYSTFLVNVLSARIIGWGIRFNAYIFFQLNLNKAVVAARCVADKF